MSVQHTANVEDLVEQGTLRKSKRGIRVESHEIKTVEEMNLLIADPANEGRTFVVAAEVFEHFMKQKQFLPAPAGDLERINDLLGTSFGKNDPFGMTRPCICQHCGHRFSFADHVESALRMGVHTEAQLRQILSGDKYYLTVDTSTPRAVICVSCEQITLTPHCCYANATYGYADQH